MNANYYLKKLYQDMQLRAYSEHAQDVCGRAVRKFLNYSGKPVEALNKDDARDYVQYLMRGNLSKSSINTYQAAIRFFFGVTLNRSINYLQMPRLKEDQPLPEILSREELARLLEHCENPKHHAMFALAYGSGVSDKSGSVQKHRARNFPDAVPHIGNQFILHFKGAFQGSNSWTFSGWLRSISTAEDISQDK